MGTQGIKQIMPMNDRLNIQKFINELEIYSNRKLNYPEEVGQILQIVMQTGLVGEFEDLIFQAKFFVSTQELMKRIGPSTDGFEKLSAEYQKSIKTAMNILKTIMEEPQSDVDKEWAKKFVAIDADGLNRFVKLSSDLGAIKNWQIDGKPLPYNSNPAVSLRSQDDTKKKAVVLLIRIQKSALLSMVLFILFLFLDTPVTTLGWILSLGIAAFLLYIILQISIMNRTLKS